jgi:hypothetical protein
MGRPNATKITSHDPGTEQRKYPRFVVALPAVIDDGDRLQTCTVIDISREGCRIRVSPTPGTKYFRIEIHLAGLNDTLAIDLAVMRWARNGDIGVEFICMSETHQERLRAVIRSCEETVGRPENPVNGQRNAPAEPVEEI